MRIRRDRGEQKELEPELDYGEQQHWDDLHRRWVDRTAYPITEVQLLAWEDWFTQFNSILYDDDMTPYNVELWTYMTQMEWDFLAPREPNWWANWCGVSPELRDRLCRLNKYQSEGLPVTELRVAQAWLDR